MNNSNEIYLDINEAVEWLKKNNYSLYGLEYTKRHINQIITDYIYVSGLSNKEIESALKEEVANGDINRYLYMKEMERHIGKISIFIMSSVSSDEIEYHEMANSDVILKIKKNQNKAPKYLINENFIRVLDFYLEDFYFNKHSFIVFKDKKQILLEINDLNDNELLTYIDCFIDDLITLIRKYVENCFFIISTTELYRLKKVLDQYKKQIVVQDKQLVNYVEHLINQMKIQPQVDESIFNKFLLRINSDIIQGKFSTDKSRLSERLYKFLKEYQLIFYASIEDDDYIIMNESSFGDRLETIIKDRQFANYLKLFTIQSIKLRNLMNNTIKDKS